MMATNQRNELKRSKSSMSLIPRITLSRPSSEAEVTTRQSRERNFTNESKRRRSKSLTTLVRLSKQPTTPLSMQRTPLRHSSTSKKDIRPVNDKKWQSDQFVKVRSFFADYPEILSNIKPFTIQSFVDAINVLFVCIDERIRVTVTTYKEQVPSLMKHLGYPATIALSLMKCVNTMHSWPQVIAVLSWLIDFINNVIYSPVTVEFINDKSHLHELIANSLFQRFITWNKGEDESEINREFESKLLEHYGFDEEKYAVLKNEMQNLEPQLEKYTKEDEELMEQIAVIKQELQRKRNEISVFKNTPKKTLEETCQERLQQITDSEKKIEEKRQKITELNEIISKQSCTFEEFEKRKQKVEALKHDLQLQKEKIDKWVEIIGNCDYQLTNTKQKLDRAVLEQNLAVMEWQHLNPIMKNLEIQVTGYAHVKDEIARVTKLKGEYYNQFIDELNTLTEKLENITHTHKLLRQEFETIKGDLEKAKQTSEKLNSEIDQYKCNSETEIKTLSRQLEDKTEKHKSLIKEKLLLTTEVDSLAKDAIVLEKTIKKEVARNIEMQKATIDFFVKLHNSIIEFANKLEEMQNGIEDKIKEVMAQWIAEKKRIMECLRSIVKEAGN